MSETTCSACRRPKATIQCEICQEFLCKNCQRFLDAATFSYLSKIPEELSHTHYCPSCFETTVEPALTHYEEQVELAKGVYFFFITQKAQVPILKKAKEAVKIENCEDRDETILRLAFHAAGLGYNAIVEADVSSAKVRNGGFQKTQWKGVGVPATIDIERLERRSRRH